MQEEMIYRAAIELIEQINQTTQPANELMNAYTRNRRYIGSKDRRKLGDLVWGYLRHRARLNYLYPAADLFEKLHHLTDSFTEPMPDSVRWEVPEWLIPLIPDAETELPALLEEAKTVLRVNGNRTVVKDKLHFMGIESELTPLSPLGLILSGRSNLAANPLYKNGIIEIQDEGSQLVGLETRIKPCQTVLDYCAGAGGKTLLFAQMMQNRGRIVAHDISEKSLNELKKRAERARVHIITTTTHLSDNQQFDHVVVDAPCSGTGTWRRCPDARWKLTQNQLAKLIETQQNILNRAAQFVKNNGMLSYMTCSLTCPENEQQVQNFLKTHPDFELVRQKQYSPARTQTDGLFVAVMKKN